MTVPKFMTPRDPAAPTLGTLQGEFARIMLGAPLMPAQQAIADVTGELRLDDTTGLWVPKYSLCVITEQRQAGKSHLAMSQIGERCFARPGFRSWYTAQTGADARDQFVKFHEEVVMGKPMEPFVRTLVGAGREVMKFKNGSQLRPHPPSEEALHGKQSDRNDIDEAWAHSEDEGRLLMTAISPTKLTRPGAQTFVWSAGGTANSTWLASLVARGRAGDPSICYVEFGIPEGADPEDLDVIAEHHPAYGHTITREALAAMRADFGDDAAGWARSAGNVWTEVVGGAIPVASWERSRALDPIPASAPVAYGAARAADGSEVVLAAAAEVAHGRYVVEVLAVIPDVYGAAAQVLASVDGDLAVDPVGPSASLHDDLTLAEAQLVPVSSRDAAAATALVLDALAVEDPPVRYRRNEALDKAVRVAGTRRLGDGGVLWARVASGASIASLEAATLALWALRHRSEPVEDDATMYFGSAA